MRPVPYKKIEGGIAVHNVGERSMRLRLRYVVVALAALSVGFLLGSPRSGAENGTGNRAATETTLSSNVQPPMR